jgi:hypothetical protein
VLHSVRCAAWFQDDLAKTFFEFDSYYFSLRARILMALD